jgi:uncharacterized membrane protein YgcG
MTALRMKRLLHQVWIFSFVLAFAFKATAQDLPPAPADGLRDDTRALSPGLRAQLVQDMATCRAALDADIWFSAGTFLQSGQSIRLQARTLRQHWSPGGRDAILVAYDRSSDAHGLSLSPGIWERYPSAEITTLIQRSMATMADKSQPLEKRLSTMLSQMLQNLQTLEKQRHRAAQPLSRHHVRLAQGFAISLGGGAVLLALLGTLSRKRDLQASWQSFFPSVQVGIRFGAPHGGGVIVEKVTGQSE